MALHSRPLTDRVSGELEAGTGPAWTVPTLRPIVAAGEDSDDNAGEAAKLGVTDLSGAPFRKRCEDPDHGSPP